MSPRTASIAQFHLPVIIVPQIVFCGPGHVSGYVDRIPNGENPADLPVNIDVAGQCGVVRRSWPLPSLVRVFSYQASVRLDAASRYGLRNGQVSVEVSDQGAGDKFEPGLNDIESSSWLEACGRDRPVRATCRPLGPHHAAEWTFWRNGLSSLLPAETSGCRAKRRA